jgi:hypothetical protein
MLDPLCNVVAVHLSDALKFLSCVPEEILIYLKPWRPADNWEGLLLMPVTYLLFFEPAWPPCLTAPVPQHAIGAVA